MKANKLTALIIMDGFGIPKDLNRSAIINANTTHLRALADKYPSVAIGASEEYVGLPEGQAGTSEVGHLTIGTGRVVLQPLSRIDKEIKTGAFYKNKVLLEAMENAKVEGRALHLVGLPSDGGIHSHINHLLALIKMAKENNVDNVYIHFITDGRDTPPKSAITYIKQVQDCINQVGVGKIATVMGRFYALDRDKNWDRVHEAYKALVNGDGIPSESAIGAVEQAYKREETDEFIMPSVVIENGKPVGTIKTGDSVISYNFRADRERQLAYVFDPDNTLDYTDKDLKTYFVCMMEYDETLKNCYVAYPKEETKNMLCEVLSDRGYKQIKLAETEKFTHLTFFFNNGKLDAFNDEFRTLINSEKMKSYAGNPKMGAYDITEKAIEAINSDNYDVMMINFANCDMVGHSGVLKAAMEAVEVVDECVSKVTKEILSKGGRVIIIADHGNADIMKYEDGSPHTAHTTNLVPCIIVDDELIGVELRKGGSLADIAPTILDLLNEEIPNEMEGKSLLIS